MPHAIVRDIVVHYQVYGPADGEPLILLHSFTSSGESFAHFLDKLQDSYRLFVVDWRGHGGTTNSMDAIHHSDLAEDTAAFVKAVGLKSAHFCGHSSGGMHLLFLGIKYPQLVRSLTLAAATYTFDDRVRGIIKSIVESEDLEEQDWVIAQQRKHEAFHGTGYIATLLRHWSESVLRPDELPFSTADLGQISCPTLIIHGDRDHFFPIQIAVDMYHAIPNSELCIVANCGHNLLHEGPVIFIEALQAFLSRAAVNSIQ